MVWIVAIVATARSLVWAWSHDTYLISVDTSERCPIGAFFSPAPSRAGAILRTDAGAALRGIELSTSLP